MTVHKNYVAIQTRDDVSIFTKKRGGIATLTGTSFLSPVYKVQNTHF